MVFCNTEIILPDLVCEQVPEESCCVSLKGTCVHIRGGGRRCLKVVSMRYTCFAGFLVKGKRWVKFVGSRVPQLFLVLFTGFGIY